MERRKILTTYIFLLFFIISGLNAQNDNSGINWLTFEEAVEKMKTEPKKMFVDVYTPWCGWCKHMDKTTFKEAHIIQYINKTYYPVKFNAEQEVPITVGDKTYKFVKGVGKKRGYHELAMAITMGRLTYPTVVFIDEDIRVLQPIPGYKNPETFEMIMTYYGNDHFKQTPWSKYQKDYIPITKIKPTLISD